MSLKYLLKKKYRLSCIITLITATALLLNIWVSFAHTSETEESMQKARSRMVARQIKRRGIKDLSVINAMLKVKRHLFVPEKMIPYAYQDHALSIGHKQTISQPYIVALMTELLEIKKDDSVLEIGTGSGYQAAILGELAQDVYSIEIIQALGKKTGQLLKSLEYKNIHLRIGNGYQGWPEHAPFDKIIVTAAPDHIPKPLIEQLKTGGRLVIPVGKSHQKLLLIRKDKNGVKRENIIAVRFVPMTGEAEK